MARVARTQVHNQGLRTARRWHTPSTCSASERSARIQPADVARLNAGLREAGLSDSTRAKHLRVLGACFASAVDHGVANQNPVRRLPRAERPRPARKESAYFEQDELGPLFAEIPNGRYQTLFSLALKTGIRQGELLALTWGDVDLQHSVLHVRRTFTGGEITTPKNSERRDVDLTDDVVRMLGAWWGACGRPSDHGALVFSGEGRTGHIAPSTLIRRVLYPAMARAGVPRRGPTGERRTFHSLRHTFAKRALESGRKVTWLSRHLGHSTLKVTHRHVRTLGAGRTTARSSPDGGCLWCLGDRLCTVGDLGVEVAAGRRGAWSPVVTT